MERCPEIAKYTPQGEAELIRLAQGLPAILRSTLLMTIRGAENGSVWINPEPRVVKPILTSKEAEEFVELDIRGLRQRALDNGFSIGGNEVTNQALEEIKADTHRRLQDRYTIIE